MLRVSVCLHLPSDRKILDRVRRTRALFLRFLIPCEEELPVANGRLLRRVMIQASPVSLSKFSCGGSSCGFSVVHLRLDHNFPLIRSCGCFSRGLAVVCDFYPSLCIPSCPK